MKLNSYVCMDYPSDLSAIKKLESRSNCLMLIEGLKDISIAGARCTTRSLSFLGVPSDTLRMAQEQTLFRHQHTTHVISSHSCARVSSSHSVP
jgi:hypothetical protein